jgi:dienelactone hydrolase
MMQSILKFCAITTAAWLITVQAQAGKIDPDFPGISYINFPSFDIVTPGQTLTIGGELRVPPNGDGDIPAVVILHGSAGVDSRGALYVQALNDAGIATLEIDMRAARGVAGPGERPPLPTFTLPDAFGALNYLADRPGIDPERIGVLGFSWGGVMSLLSANQSYTGPLGNGRQFAAHVANYPVCWAYNIGLPGIEFDNLTGAPVLIQIGDKDDYDEGAGPCQNLADPFEEVSVRVYRNAYHAWDRLQPGFTAEDPFSHLGAGGIVNFVPNPGKAQQSSRAVVEMFSDAFGLSGQ